MKDYASPSVEFIEFKNDDIMTTSQCTTNACTTDTTCGGYVCPNAYGNTCPGNPYGGT